MTMYDLKAAVDWAVNPQTEMRGCVKSKPLEDFRHFSNQHGKRTINDDDYDDDDDDFVIYS